MQEKRILNQINKMKQSNKEIELNHDAIDLYLIVLDIKKYPDYIPWCNKIEILETDKNFIKANMTVNYKFFSTQDFTSRVEYNKKKMIITTTYINGPLKNLQTKWEFIQIEKKKSKIIFTLEFEFKNFVHQKLAELFFPLIEVKMMDSFIKRANEILD